MKFIFIISAICFSNGMIYSQAALDINTANNYYRSGNFGEALLLYQKALQAEPENITAKFNLANTFYRTGQVSAANKLYDEISQSSGDPSWKAKAYYNRGAIYSKDKRLEESIEAYKNALRNDPEDKQARENLQKALLELKKKQPEKKKEDQKKNQEQKKQPEPKMNQKEAEQRLKLLEQKEKELQQRLQKEKSRSGGGQGKDW